MKKELKILIESLVVSLCILISVILFFVTKGYFTTKTYQPKIQDVYIVTEELTHEVRIGWIKPLSWSEYISSYLIILCIYFLIRFGLWKFFNKKKT
ncbi:hypothetical protein DFP95_1077 [Cohnella lupini]|uniref:Uncharacterized protein n=1 Tax=Cohnella lupini TaxID=1294267 RepID=A0A3D9IC95_9BACL|nr:hypothetical protein DFP95_1077 [Cohnella lupini]